MFRDIRNSSDEELKDARDILKRIDTRKHYKLVSEALPKRDEEIGLRVTFRNTKTHNPRRPAHDFHQRSKRYSLAKSCLFFFPCLSCCYKSIHHLWKPFKCLPPQALECLRIIFSRDPNVYQILSTSPSVNNRLVPDTSF